MNSISLDGLLEAIDSLGPEKPVIAFVVASRLEGKLRRMFKERSPVTSDPNPLGFSAPGCWGITCYFDPRQPDDCLAFYDRDMLRLYLKRYTSREAWLEWAEYMVASIKRVQSSLGNKNETPL